MCILSELCVRAGGTIAQLVAQGTRVVYVIFTNGDKGCQDGSIYNCTTITAEAIADIRHTEAQNVWLLSLFSDVTTLF